MKGKHSGVGSFRTEKTSVISPNVKRMGRLLVCHVTDVVGRSANDFGILPAFKWKTSRQRILSRVNVIMGHNMLYGVFFLGLIHGTVNQTECYGR